MKTLKFISIFFLLFYFSCTAQNKEKLADNTQKPNENIHVNKEYDEYGNLKKYDSIYSYSYSSNGKLSDSLKFQFQKHFNKHTFFNDSFFNDFFTPDSITGGFTSKDFFYKGFMNQDEHIKSMMKRMDSIQQLFFNQASRSIIPAQPKEIEHKKI